MAEVVVADLSDPHLDVSPAAVTRLVEVANQLGGLGIQPNVVIVSNDLTQGVGPLCCRADSVGRS